MQIATDGVFKTSGHSPEQLPPRCREHPHCEPQQALKAALTPQNSAGGSNQGKKNENKPKQPQHCRQLRLTAGRGRAEHPRTAGQEGWGTGAPWFWGIHHPLITLPGTSSPCCELCRRRPWRPGPEDRLCSRGSWGCSASPAPPLWGSTEVTPAAARIPLPGPTTTRPAVCPPGHLSVPPLLAVPMDADGTAWPRHTAPSLLPRRRRSAPRAAHERQGGRRWLCPKPPGRWDLSGPAAKH